MKNRIQILCLLVVIIFSSAPAHAFEIGTAISQPIHENITRDALYFLRDDVQNVLIEANRQVDLSALPVLGDCPDTGCVSHEWEHFDNCQFSASVNHINNLYRRAHDSALLDLDRVAENFGRLLHTAQDFYAHSNWVELGQSDLFDRAPGYWRTVVPKQLIGNVMVIEGSDSDFPPDAFTFGGTRKRVTVTHAGQEYLALISGVAYTTEGCPARIAVGHWDGGTGLNPPNVGSPEGLNKDHPDRIGYYAARLLAVAQTTHEWCRLLNLTRDTYGSEGLSTLVNAWVIPDSIDSALGECGHLNLSLDVISDVPELTTLESGAGLTPATATNALDLIFVIDTTGSMADDIAEVKRRAVEIINQVAANSPDWRIAVVTYRDHPQPPYGDPGDYVSQLDLPFSANQTEIISKINAIQVGGGGDGPEAVFAGLLHGIGQPWRDGVRKILILMGDAPPHDPDPILGYTYQIVLQAAYDVDPASIFPILIESANAVRFPFQVLADGSSGRLFYAANASEVVPILLSTIDAATGTQLSIGLDVQVVSLEPGFPIRTAPSMRASIISLIPRGESASIIDGPRVVFEMSSRNVPQNFIWWQVRTASGLEGWIQETYYGEPILLPGANAVTPATCTLTTIRDVNIRSGPGTQYQQIASRAGEGNALAANGQFGNIATPDQHWWQLYPGYWIRNDQVRESGDCANLPRITVP